MILSASAFAAPKHWVVGFSQFGSESDWRTASTVSIQSAFLDDPSFTLIYSEAQQKQENQIKAIRSFIARKVNAILITPLVETDYGPVLQEAKKAGIPVVMIDRDVAKDDRALRIAFMGSSFVKEGEKAANWLADYLKKMNMDDGNKSVNIVELTGTPGAAPSIERGKGFRKISDLHSNWKITQSQPGNFTSDEGAAVTTAFLTPATRLLHASPNGGEYHTQMNFSPVYRTESIVSSMANAGWSVQTKVPDSTACVGLPWGNAG